MRNLVETERYNGIGTIHSCLKNQRPTFGLTFRMKFHIWLRGGRWFTLGLTQSECRRFGFLSGERGHYHAYNNLVEVCGHVIRTAANLHGNSAVGIKYFWFDPFTMNTEKHS